MAINHKAGPALALVVVLLLSASAYAMDCPGSCATELQNAAGQKGVGKYVRER